MPAPNIVQAVGASGTTATTLGISVAHPALGDLMVTALQVHGLASHISAISVSDNGSNAGWTISSSLQATASSDFLIAYRTATATDVTSLTLVTWGWTTAGTKTVAEFDEYNTGSAFVGLATLDPGGAGDAVHTSTTSISTEITGTGATSHPVELVVLAAAQATTNGGSVAWTSSHTASLPTPTATSPTGTPAPTLLNCAFSVTSADLTSAVTATESWSTAQQCAIWSLAFYDPNVPAVSLVGAPHVEIDTRPARVAVPVAVPVTPVPVDLGARSASVTVPVAVPVAAPAVELATLPASVSLPVGITVSVTAPAFELVSRPAAIAVPVAVGVTPAAVEVPTGTPLVGIGIHVSAAAALIEALSRGGTVSVPVTVAGKPGVIELAATVAGVGIGVHVGAVPTLIETVPGIARLTVPLVVQGVSVPVELVTGSPGVQTPVAVSAQPVAVEIALRASAAGASIAIQVAETLAELIGARVTVTIAVPPEPFPIFVAEPRQITFHAVKRPITFVASERPNTFEGTP
jgi:hypothetical protein